MLEPDIATALAHDTRSGLDLALDASIPAPTRIADLESSGHSSPSCRSAPAPASSAPSDPSSNAQMPADMPPRRALSPLASRSSGTAPSAPRQFTSGMLPRHHLPLHPQCAASSPHCPKRIRIRSSKHPPPKPITPYPSHRTNVNTPAGPQ